MWSYYTFVLSEVMESDCWICHKTHARKCEASQEIANETKGGGGVFLPGLEWMSLIFVSN